MHIVIDRSETLKALQAKLAKRRKALALELRVYRVATKAKALEAVRQTLHEIEAFDPEVEGRIPEVVLRPLPYEARQAPELGLGNIGHAINVLNASCEARIKLNENDATAQIILLHSAKAA
ncbi:MAG: hypothetical protein HC933_19970 [Pleurocapsa sp. SU_196_0]|nr:hypothetical protein [Pleurocapsa sp. SU_196_0]